jgi:hypothetical protein
MMQDAVRVAPGLGVGQKVRDGDRFDVVEQLHVDVPEQRGAVSNAESHCAVRGIGGDLRGSGQGGQNAASQEERREA